MGAIVNGQCVSQQMAIDDFFSRAPVTSIPTKDGYMQVYYSWAPSGWLRVVDNYRSDGVLVTANTFPVVPPDFAECSPGQNFLSGAALGWMVALALIAVYCVKLARRAV